MSPRSWFIVMGIGLAAAGSRAEEISAKDAAAVPPPAEVEHADVPEVSDADKPQHTERAVGRMSEILTKVQQNLEEARDERNMVKLNCVGEKLAAVKGLLRISEQAHLTMKEALTKRDVEVAAHEFEKIGIAGKKCEQLLGESEACVGELAVFTGDTEIEMTVEGVRSDDPTTDVDGVYDVFSEEDGYVKRPPSASPYQ